MLNWIRKAFGMNDRPRGKAYELRCGCGLKESRLLIALPGCQLHYDREAAEREWNGEVQLNLVGPKDKICVLIAQFSTDPRQAMETLRFEPDVRVSYYVTSEQLMYRPRARQLTEEEVVALALPVEYKG